MTKLTRYEDFKKELEIKGYFMVRSDHYVTYGADQNVFKETWEGFNGMIVSQIEFDHDLEYVNRIVENVRRDEIYYSTPINDLGSYRLGETNEGSDILDELGD